MQNTQSEWKEWKTAAAAAAATKEAMRTRKRAQWKKKNGRSDLDIYLLFALHFFASHFGEHSYIRKHFVVRIVAKMCKFRISKAVDELVSNRHTNQ